MVERDEKFNKLYDILKASAIVTGREPYRSELFCHENWNYKRLICHLLGCHGYWFQFAYNKVTNEYLFAAEHSEMTDYYDDKQPCILSSIQSSFCLNITEMGEEESIRRIQDIIKWIMLNKEESFVYSLFPNAFIYDEKKRWIIPRFKLAYNPNLSDPENLSLYNFLVQQMRPGARKRIDDICHEVYKAYFLHKQKKNQIYADAISIWRKEYPMDILNFIPIFRAVMIDEKGRINLYISRKVLKAVDSETLSLYTKDHNARVFLGKLLVDKYNPVNIEDQLDYIFDKHCKNYNRLINTDGIICDSSIPYPLKKGIKSYLSFADDYKMSIKPFDSLPSDIDFFEEKDISYWLSINTDDMRFNPYEFDLKWDQNMHQFNAGDPRLVGLMVWMENNYFNTREVDVK